MRLGSHAPKLLILGSVVLFLIILPGLVNFGATWLWMQEVGFEVVLVREIVTRIALMVGVGLLSYAFLRLNLGVAERSRRVVAKLDDREISLAAPVAGPFARLPGALAIAASVLIALIASGGWLAVLKFRHAVPFGVADPMLGRDVAFYAFTLPVISGVLALLVALTVLALLFSALSYLSSSAIALTGGGVTSGGVIVPPQQLRVSRPAASHFSSLAALFLVLAALQIWLVQIPGLLFSSTGPLVGASYTDVHARLPGLHVAAAVALLAAGVVIAGIVRGRSGRFTLGAIAGLALVSVLPPAAYPALIQKLVVAPTELTREQPYLARHIEATRRAWGLDGVTTGDLRGEATLTLADIRANAPTI